MLSRFSPRPALWLGIGLAVGVVGGLIAGGVWPQTPLHAVATDRNETFAMATGPVDEDVEAVFLLDFLTGDLRGVVLGKQAGAGFNAFFAHNVLADLQVDPAKNPRFLMTTGLADLRQGGGMAQPSRCVVYVAEVTTGKVAAYGLPWSRAARASGQIIKQPMVLLGMTRFRTPVGIGIEGK